MLRPISKRAKNGTTPDVTSRYYLSNSSLLPEVIKAKALGRVTDELGRMLLMLTRKYAQRSSFSGYTYKEDMISEAVTSLCQNALKFNPEIGSNPFAYYTSCINNSFLQSLILEKRHQRVRDQLLVDIGENPSYSFADEVKANRGGEYSGELLELTGEIAEAKDRLLKEAADKVVRTALDAAERAATELETIRLSELAAARLYENLKPLEPLPCFQPPPQLLLEDKSERQAAGEPAREET